VIVNGGPGSSTLTNLGKDVQLVQLVGSTGVDTL
jgi:hypothetical protein